MRMSQLMKLFLLLQGHQSGVLLPTRRFVARRSGVAFLTHRQRLKRVAEDCGITTEAVERELGRAG